MEGQALLGANRGSEVLWRSQGRGLKELPTGCVGVLEKACWGRGGQRVPATGVALISTGSFIFWINIIYNNIKMSEAPVVAPLQPPPMAPGQFRPPYPPPFMARPPGPHMMSFQRIMEEPRGTKNPTLYLQNLNERVKIPDLKNALY